MAKKQNRRTTRQKQNSKNFKQVEAKTDNQESYIRSIIENDIIFCTGPIVTGKLLG